MAKDTIRFNLKNFLSKLVIKFPTINSCYLFGSRAYKTGSLRSDIDVLVYTEKPLKQAQVTRFCECYKPIDLFETSDNITAKSLTNGSAIYDKENLIEKLDAILLWERGNGFKNDSFHKHEILKNADFIPSTLPITLASELIDERIPKTELGKEWEIASKRIIEIIKNSMLVSKKLRKPTQAKNINIDTLKIKSEYDFQNYTYIVLKPWIDSLDTEPFIVKVDGSKKNADFSISDNLLILEEKYIDDNGKKDAVIKTIDGLNDFYKTQPNVKVVIFLILFEETVSIDVRQLEQKYTNITSTPKLICSFIKNEL